MHIMQRRRPNIQMGLRIRGHAGQIRKVQVHQLWRFGKKIVQPLRRQRQEITRNAGGMPLPPALSACPHKRYLLTEMIEIGNPIRYNTPIN